MIKPPSSKGDGGFALRVINCSTVNDFIEFVSPAHELYRGCFKKFIFRGHADASWKLLPSVFRSGSAEELGLPNWPINKPYFRRESEFRSLMSFLEALNDSGGYLANNDILISTLRRDHSLERLEDHAQGLKLWPSKEYIPIMALAQHYGLPTRLLDFTFNPLVAAYFSVVDLVFKKIKSEHVCVYAFDVDMAIDGFVGGEVDFYAVKPYALKSDFYIPVTAPYHFNGNMKLQSGLFMMYVDAQRKYDEFSPTSFDDWVRGNELSFNEVFGCDAFLKITLPSKFAIDVFDFLHANFVNGSSLFSGAEGAVKYAKERSVLDSWKYGKGDSTVFHD